ncbi:MAG: type II toxin-antitoxin system VapC family toxin [Beijerinckiaceae bacterium]
MYLLDTNVVSELRRARPHGAVLEWLRSAADSGLAICAATIGEIQAGVEKTRPHDSKRAGQIDLWLSTIVQNYVVLPHDAEAFRAWGRIMHGKSPTLAMDAMIASVALTRGLVVATRNVKDFAGFGVKTVDPFSHR